MVVGGCKTWDGVGWAVIWMRRVYLHVEHHRKGGEGDHEDDPKEDEIHHSLIEHRRRQGHLGDEHLHKLDDLEQLDAHAEREVELGRT